MCFVGSLRGQQPALQKAIDQTSAEGARSSASLRKRLIAQKELEQTSAVAFGVLGLQALLDEGYSMSSSSATQIEKDLDGNSDDLQARIKLIAFYTSHLDGRDLEAVRQARRGHIFWLIQNRPEAEILSHPVCLINRTGEPLADEEGFRQGKSLWEKQIANSPDDVSLLEHAASYFETSDKVQAERLILKLIQKNSNYTTWLGRLYGMAILGVMSREYRTGRPLTTAPEERDSDFSKRALSSVNVSNDSGLVSFALQVVAKGGRDLHRAGTLAWDYQPVCHQIAMKATTLNDLFRVVDCNGVEQPSRVRLDGEFMAGKLIKTVTPLYPLAAQKYHVTGTVSFNAVVGVDGTMKELHLVSGHPLFVKAASAAVKQWKFRPVFLDGSPVEIVTMINLSFGI